MRSSETRHVHINGLIPKEHRDMMSEMAEKEDLKFADILRRVIKKGLNLEAIKEGFK